MKRPGRNQPHEECLSPPLHSRNKDPKSSNRARSFFMLCGVAPSIQGLVLAAWKPVLLWPLTLFVLVAFGMTFRVHQTVILTDENSYVNDLVSEPQPGEGRSRRLSNEAARVAGGR